MAESGWNCSTEFHIRYEGEMEGQPPSHVVTGRTQGHSLHQMQRSWACVSRWTGILLVSQSLWTLKREREGCSGRIWSAMWGAVRVECCEVWDHMWDVAKWTVIVIIAATVLITVKPLLLQWLWCDCAWRTHDSGKWCICNAVLAIAKVINKSSKATVSLHFTNDSKQCPYTSHHMWVLSMSSSVSAVSSPKEARRVWCGWGSRTITSLSCMPEGGVNIRSHYI